MLYRAKVMAVVISVVATLSVVGVESASANWFINGVELVSSAALEESSKIHGDATLLVATLGLKVLCSGGTVHLEHGAISFKNILRGKGLKLLGCNTSAPASGCALDEPNQAIAFLPFEGRVSLAVFPEDRVEFTPQTKTTLANIDFDEANTCAFNGLEPVTGSIVFALPRGQDEELTQPLSGLGSVENNSLQVAGDKMSLHFGYVLLGLVNRFLLWAERRLGI